MTMNMDPLQLLIASSSKIVLMDDNAKTHAPRNAVMMDPKPSPCRWQSSPVNARKPCVLNAMGKRGGLPSSALTSLKSLVAPVHRERTIPLLDEDYDRDEYSDSESHSDGPERENVQLNQKLNKASELLSEYLRVATEELCLDYDDDGTVTTASALTMSSHGTAESQQSSTSSSASSASSSNLTSNVRKPVRTSSRSLISNVRKPVRQRSREDLSGDLIAAGL